MLTSRNLTRAAMCHARTHRLHTRRSSCGACVRARSVFGALGEYEQQGAVTAKGTAGEVLTVTWAWGQSASSLERHVVACTLPASGVVRISMVFGARLSTGKAFHGYCDGEYVYGPLLA
jgi:hypothetical protein